MPFPNSNETQSEYIKRAIPIFKSEGKTTKQALGAAYGFYKEYGNKNKIFGKRKLNGNF